MNKLEDVAENVPWKQVERLREVLDQAVTPKDLDGIQSEIKAEIRKLSSGTGEINQRKISRLSDLNQSIDALLQKASSAETPGAQKLKTARTFWRKEVIDKFKKGDIGDILATRGGDYRVKDSQIASRFFKPGPQGIEAAKKFNAAIGNNPKAMTAIEDAAKQDLLSKFPTGEITETGLRRWLNQHKGALAEYNLTGKFDDLVKARRQLDDAIRFKKEFDSSEAAKLLGADPQNAIVNALNSGNKGRAAANLMKQTRGNTAAQNGLKNALSDHILEQSQNPATGMVTRLDKLDQLLKKYKPAMNVLYADDKAALKAFSQARDAFRVNIKGSKSPVGGGSDTAENVLTSAFKALGVSSGRVGSLVRAFIDPLKKQEMNKVNALVNQALLNPDYAYTLKLIAETAEPEVKGVLPKYSMGGRGTFADVMQAMPNSFRKQFLSGRGEYVRTGELPAYLQRRITQHMAAIGLASKSIEEEPAQ